MVLIPEPAASATHFKLDIAWNIQSMDQNLEAWTRPPLTRLQVGGMSRNGGMRDSRLNKKQAGRRGLCGLWTSCRN